MPTFPGLPYLQVHGAKQPRRKKKIKNENKENEKEKTKMNTNMMELNMNEMELVNGGVEWGKIFKEAAWGVGIGAANTVEAAIAYS